MLSRLDRIQFAAAKAEPVALSFQTLFGAGDAIRDRVGFLGAERWTLPLGQSFVEILEPISAGPVREFVDRRGSGLFAAGFSTPDLDGLCKRLYAAGAVAHVEGGQAFVGPTPIGGLRAVISQEPEVLPGHQGLLTHFYEVTNPVRDLVAAVEFYVRAFGLDPLRFHPIASKLYGYTGTLTLFDPPAKLDRIEVTQTYDPGLAMGRFFERNGESLYMAFAETDDFAALRASLDRQGVRYALRGEGDYSGAPNVLFIHPRSLHGMLLGVSETGVAWEWSSAAGAAAHA